MELSDRQARLVSGGVVSLVGVSLLSIPVYDVWSDVMQFRWDVPATVLENVLPLGLALVLVYGGVRLTRLEWEGEYAMSVTRWTVLGALGSTVLFLWIVSIQVFAASLRPYVIALNGILLGTVVSFGVGIYAASRDRTRRGLRREHDRRSALFGNTSDYVAAARVTPEGFTVETVNDALATAVADPESLLSDVLDSEEALDGVRGVLRRAQDDQLVEIHYDRGDREFFVRIVPVEVSGDGADVFFVLTDITEQTELAREVAARERIEYLHTVASEMAGVARASEACELTVEAIDRTLPVEAVALQVDGSVVAARGTEGLFDSEAAERAGSAGAGAVSGGRRAIHTQSGSVVTIRVGDRGLLQVAGGDVDETQLTAIELLATHLREALTRIDRREELEQERERMAVLTRVVRHDLLDDVNVLKTQLELLERHVPPEGAERLATIDERVEAMVEQLETTRSFMQAVERQGEHRQPIALGETIRQQADRVRETEPSITVDVDVPDRDVLADDLLVDVFRNLLSNARKHGDGEQVHVRIDGEVRGDVVEVRVGDDGPGIPPERRGAVFDRGERTGPAPGSGVGLYLVEQLVHNYGGSVSVGESDLGGAEFRVTLPLAAQESTAA